MAYKKFDPLNKDVEQYSIMMGPPTTTGEIAREAVGRAFFPTLPQARAPIERPGAYGKAASTAVPGVMAYNLLKSGILNAFKPKPMEVSSAIFGDRSWQELPKMPEILSQGTKSALQAAASIAPIAPLAARPIENIPKDILASTGETAADLLGQGTFQGGISVAASKAEQTLSAKVLQRVESEVINTPKYRALIDQVSSRSGASKEIVDAFFKRRLQEVVKQQSLLNKIKDAQLMQMRPGFARVGSTAYHQTTKRGAVGILKQGFRMPQAGTEFTTGPAVSLTRELLPKGTWGDVTLKVDISKLKIINSTKAEDFIIAYSDKFERQHSKLVDEDMEKADALMRIGAAKELVKKGYDAIEIAPKEASQILHAVPEIQIINPAAFKKITVELVDGKGNAIKAPLNTDKPVKTPVSRASPTAESIFKLETETDLDNLIGNKKYEGGGNYKNLAEYFEKVKGQVGKIVYMTPDEYLSKINYQSPSKESAKYFKIQMAKNRKLPIGYLDYTGSRLSQEGRNRAYLAKRLGIEKIPVLITAKDRLQLEELTKSYEYRSVGAAGVNIKSSTVPLGELPKKPITVRTASGEKKTITPEEDENFSITPVKKPNGAVMYKLHDGQEYVIPTGVAQDLINRYGDKPIKEFAPELNNVEVVVKGTKPLPNDIAKEDYIQKTMEEEGISRELAERSWLDFYSPEILPSSASETKFSQYQLPGGENYREVLIKAPIWDEKPLLEGKGKVKVSKEVFQSFHWDEPNVLAHLRLDDHTTPNGKKILFIEELQSDWAREARKPIPPNRTESAIPQHPLLKNWQELALKQVLKIVTKEGYDGIAWTTGEQQIKRYPGAEAEKDTEKMRLGTTWAHNLYDRQIPNILKDLTKGETGEVVIGQSDKYGVYNTLTNSRVTQDGVYTKAEADKIAEKLRRINKKEWQGKPQNFEVRPLGSSQPYLELTSSIRKRILA